MDLQEVKSAIDESNRLFATQFTETNAKIKALEAKGAAVDPVLRESMDKMNARMNDLGDVKEQFIRLSADVNRLNNAPLDAKVETRREELRGQFNRELRANASLSGRTVADVDAEGLKAYDAAFLTYLRRGENGLSHEQKTGMYVGSEPDGGYTVTPDLSGRIVARNFELSPIRSYARVETIGSDALEGENETDDASGSWVGELASRPDTTTPTVGKYRIVAFEVYAQPKSSQKLLEDSNRDIQAWLVGRTANKFARLESTAFAVGTGIVKPRGFASYTTAATADASRSWGTFEHVATGTSATFGTDPNGIQKLIALIHKMNPIYLPGAAFYMNRNTLSTLRQLTDASTTGRFVFVPSMQANMPDTLMGYPVRTVVDMVDMAASSSSLAFGDLAETYTIVDRVGLSLLVDPFTDKPNVRFYTRKRVGGDVVNFESLKFMKFI